MGPGLFDGMSDSGSRASIRGDYVRFREECSVVCQFFPSSVVDLLSLMISVVEAMSRASIMEVRVRALESTLSSNNAQIGEL